MLIFHIPAHPLPLTSISLLLLLFPYCSLFATAMFLDCFQGFEFGVCLSRCPAESWIWPLSDSQLALASILLLRLLLPPPPTSPQLPCCGSHKRLLGVGQSEQPLPPFSQPLNIMSTMDIMSNNDLHCNKNAYVLFWGLTAKPSAVANTRQHGCKRKTLLLSWQISFYTILHSLM